MRVLAAVLVVGLLAPLAAAQQLINPIQGKYEDVYLVAGRAIDKDGRPVVRGAVTVDLDAPGVPPTPLELGTDCYGLFLGYYTLKDVPKGRIHATVKGSEGEATATAELDGFFRRSDLKVQYPGHDRGVCSDTQQVNASQRISVSGRILERVDPYDAGGRKLEARPFAGYVRVALVYNDTRQRFCPPAENGGDLCDPVPVDERGDFRYSWTFNKDIDPRGGHVELTAGNRTWNLTLDSQYRIAFAEVESTGRGPPVAATPGPAPILVVALVALAAVGARRLLPRRPA